VKVLGKGLGGAARAEKRAITCDFAIIAMSKVHPRIKEGT